MNLAMALGLGGNSAGVPFKLVVTGQPANTAGGGTIQTGGAGPLTVAVQDVNGNTCPGVWAIMVTIGTNPGPGTLGGTRVQTTSLGIASFNDLAINSPNAANGYTLKFTMADGSLPVVSNTFNITSSAGGTLRTVNSTGNPTSDGTTLRTTITGSSSLDIVKVGAGTFDFGSSTCLVPSGVSVIGSGINSTTIMSESTAANANAAIGLSTNGTFSDFTIQANADTVDIVLPIGAGTGDNAFTGAIVERVNIQGYSDAVYLAKNVTGTFLNCTISSFVDVLLCTLNATLTIANCTLSSAGSPLVSTWGYARGLLNQGAQPFNVYNSSITIAPSGSTGGAPLLSVGAYSKHVTGSISLFACSISTNNGANPTYDLFQSAGTLNEFGTAYNHANTHGTLGLCNALAITQQPTTVAHGSPISPSITVAYQDGQGNTQSVTNGVQVFLNKITGSGTLSGTTTQAAVAGVATFGDLVVSSAGTYTLTFAALGMQSVTSAPFTVT